MSENLNVCLINDSFPPEIDGVANAVTNYADIITRKHGRCTIVTPDNPAANDAVFPFPVLRPRCRKSLRRRGLTSFTPTAPSPPPCWPAPCVTVSMCRWC